MTAKIVARAAALAAPFALVLHLASAQAGWAASTSQAPGAAVPQLPDAPPLIGPLRRGANGEIELITPEGERKAGRPLCAPGARCVGKGEAYPTLAAALAVARAGDTIDVIGGTYREAATIGIARLTLRGTAGRPHFDCAGVPLAGDKACLAIAADGVTLDNLEISGAAQAVGGEGACIHSDGDLRLTLSDIFCHGSQSGLVVAGGTIVISHSEFYENGGGGDGRNADFGRDCTSVTVSGSAFRDSTGGAEFTSRCLRAEISDSTFRSTRSLRALDFPVGGDAMVYRSTIEKGEGTRGKEIVAFASAACEHRGSLQLKQVEIANSRYDAIIVNSDKCVGDPITFEQVMVDGLPVATQGFIVDLGGNQLGGAAPGAVAGQRAPPSFGPPAGPGAPGGTNSPGAGPQGTSAPLATWRRIVPQARKIVTRETGAMNVARTIAAMAAALFVAIPVSGAADLKIWRQGTLDAKSDAGILFMVERGFAEKQGLKLDIVQFHNDVIELQALLAGELDSYGAVRARPSSRRRAAPT